MSKTITQIQEEVAKLTQRNEENGTFQKPQEILEFLRRHNTKMRDIMQSVKHSRSSEWMHSREAFDAYKEMGMQRGVVFAEHANAVLYSNTKSQANKVAYIYRPTGVIGDTHGAYDSSIEKVKLLCGEDDTLHPKIAVLNTGDLISRGTHSIENLLFWLILQREYPEQVAILAGNHERRETWSTYGQGWRKQFPKKLQGSVLNCLQDITDEFPLMAQITPPEGKDSKQSTTVLSTHGGVLCLKDRKVEVTLEEAQGAYVRPNSTDNTPIWNDWTLDPQGEGMETSRGGGREVGGASRRCYDKKGYDRHVSAHSHKNAENHLTVTVMSTCGGESKMLPRDQAQHWSGDCVGGGGSRMVFVHQVVQPYIRDDNFALEYRLHPVRQFLDEHGITDKLADYYKKRYLDEGLYNVYDPKKYRSGYALAHFIWERIKRLSQANYPAMQEFITSFEYIMDHVHQDQGDFKPLIIDLLSVHRQLECKQKVDEKQIRSILEKKDYAATMTDVEKYGRGIFAILLEKLRRSHSWKGVQLLADALERCCSLVWDKKGMVGVVLSACEQAKSCETEEDFLQKMRSVLEEKTCKYYLTSKNTLRQCRELFKKEKLDDKLVSVDAVPPEFLESIYPNLHANDAMLQHLIGQLWDVHPAWRKEKLFQQFIEACVARKNSLKCYGADKNGQLLLMRGLYNAQMLAHQHPDFKEFWGAVCDEKSEVGILKDCGLSLQHPVVQRFQDQDMDIPELYRSAEGIYPDWSRMTYEGRETYVKDTLVTDLVALGSDEQLQQVVRLCLEHRVSLIQNVEAQTQYVQSIVEVYNLVSVQPVGREAVREKAMFFVLEGLRGIQLDKEDPLYPYFQEVVKQVECTQDIRLGELTKELVSKYQNQAYPDPEALTEKAEEYLSYVKSLTQKSTRNKRIAGACFAFVGATLAITGLALAVVGVLGLLSSLPAVALIPPLAVLTLGGSVAMLSAGVATLGLVVPGAAVGAGLFFHSANQRDAAYRFGKQAAKGKPERNGYQVI